jgi:DSBA-like thioredoxin domain
MLRLLLTVVTSEWQPYYALKLNFFMMWFHLIPGSGLKSVSRFRTFFVNFTLVIFQALCRYQPHWNMDLVLRPFFLGGIMKHSGNRPPMMVPAKALYMNKDLQRNAAYFQVPLKVIEV